MTSDDDTTLTETLRARYRALRDSCEIVGVDIHLYALDRHKQWETEFAHAGDPESALDARLDALAIAGELGMPHGDPPPRAPR